MNKYFSSLNDIVFYVMENISVISTVVWVPSPHIVYTVSSFIDTMVYSNLDTLTFGNYMPEESITDSIQSTGFSFYTLTVGSCQKRITEKLIGGTTIFYSPLDGCFQYSFEPTTYNTSYAAGIGVTVEYWYYTIGGGVENKYSLYAFIKSNDTCGVAINLGWKETVLKNQLRIFPNPSNETIFVIREEIKSTCNLQLFDCLGRVVKEIQVQKGEENSTINVSNLPSGFYFLKLKSEKGASTEKIIIQH